MLMVIFWLICCLQDHRSIARFIGYALCAADEALRDANWFPSEQNEKERTVMSYFTRRFMRANFY